MKKKLTKPQIAALERLRQGRADFYDLMRVGANGSSTAALSKHGLIVECGALGMPRTYQLTDAGMDALSNGFITV